MQVVLLPAMVLAAMSLDQQPAAPAAAPAAYHVDGFRSARFGMTMDQVREAASRDFGAAAKSAKTIGRTEEGQSALQISLLRLDPGPGAATVTYLFDAASGKLVHVNVGWMAPAPASDDQRQAMLNSGMRLRRYFIELPAPPVRSEPDILARQATLTLYRGSDESGANVTVLARGVPFKKVETEQAGTVQPTGPALLIVSYDAPRSNARAVAGS